MTWLGIGKLCLVLAISLSLVGCAIPHRIVLYLVPPVIYENNIIQAFSYELSEGDMIKITDLQSWLNDYGKNDIDGFFEYLKAKPLRHKSGGQFLNRKFDEVRGHYNRLEAK